MKIPLYQVDAFTSEIFKGNPAAVCMLNEWLDDAVYRQCPPKTTCRKPPSLLKKCEIRWFSPSTEIALCGHATLASAFILFNFLQWPENTIRFQTRQSGILTVTKKETLLEMDFPARPPTEQKMPDGLIDALGHQPVEVLSSAEDMLVVFDDERTVREISPDFFLLAQGEQRGTIVTAPSDECDFVSRFFAPRVGIPEDPVTGSAHCVLIPYWSRRLSKKQLYAKQISRRGGELFCEDRGERVTIAGRAVLYLEGTIVV